MASEMLGISEDYLEDGIKVIRAGLKALGDIVPKALREDLEDWCKSEEDYLKRLSRED